MAYLVTLKAGLVDVALPNGQIAQGGQVALLTDDQYMMLSPTAGAALFSAVSVPAAGTVPTTTVGAQVPLITGVNPYMESSSGEPSSATTPLNTPYETF